MSADKSTVWIGLENGNRSDLLMVTSLGLGLGLAEKVMSQVGLDDLRSAFHKTR